MHTGVSSHPADLPDDGTPPRPTMESPAADYSGLGPPGASFWPVRRRAHVIGYSSGAGLRCYTEDAAHSPAGLPHGPRFHLHVTPTSVSGLNLVEPCFAIFTAIIMRGQTTQASVV